MTLAVLGEPTTKCPHGVFKAGEPVARYCSFCNPASAFGISGGQGEPIIEEPEEQFCAEDDCSTLDLVLPIAQAGEND